MVSCYCCQTGGNSYERFYPRVERLLVSAHLVLAVCRLYDHSNTIRHGLALRAKYRLDHDTPRLDLFLAACKTTKKGDVPCHRRTRDEFIVYLETRNHEATSHDRTARMFTFSTNA